MERTEAHNKKIGEGVRKYYANESEEKKKERFKAIEERNLLEKEFRNKLKEVFSIYEKLNM